MNYVKNANVASFFRYAWKIYDCSFDDFLRRVFACSIDNHSVLMYATKDTYTGSDCCIYKDDKI